jgi:transcriptional regulator with XRE-family HTH domain
MMQTSASSLPIELHSLQQLGAAVRAKRKTSALRIDDAASFAGVSVDLLSRLENGSTGVSTARLLKVLDALGLALVLVDKAQLPALRHALETSPKPV